MPRSVGRTSLLDPVSEQVETTMLRALAVLRLLVAVYAVVLNAARWREFEHAAAGWTVVAVIVVWTLVATWAYDAPRRRTLALLVADLAVAAGTLLSTVYVQSDAMLDRHAATMPSFWVMTAVLAWAVVRGWPYGLAAAVLVSLLDLTVHPEATGSSWGNIFLLLLGAGVVGYSTGLIRDAAEARAEAERIAAGMAERARLARAVHDGVLQVLSLVKRRGIEAGGDLAELGRLAGEQEAALRALVQGSSTPVASGSGLADLAERLGRLQSQTVSVAGPGHLVLLPVPVVEELASVVAACLDNVHHHVGPDAPAWVLVEDLGDRVVVSVRDEGPGIVTGRLEQARSEGRLGVAESIRGRMSELGGEAVLTTAPDQGTEWELVVSGSPERPSR